MKLEEFVQRGQRAQKAVDKVVAQATTRRGRPTGPKLPCGACHAQLTATEWRAHFTICPERPQ